MMFSSSAPLSCSWVAATSILLLSIIPSLAQAQQLPTLNLPLFFNDKNQTYRQDLCERFRAFTRTGESIEFALEGLQLHTAVIAGNFLPLDANGAINAEYPGLAGRIMDELANRGRFTWRESFAAYDGPGENKTWTNLLMWTTEYYDVSADWWTETLDRLKLGRTFPHGWYDASYILVGAEQGKDQTTINFWAWTQPFEWTVWAVIAGTILVSGAVYQVLEYMGCPERHHLERKHETLGNDIFLSMLLFAQHFQFSPRTPASRIFAASMATWSLLISSAYTANLASFFVIQNTPNVEVQSIDDAIRLGLPLCIYASTAPAVYVEKHYPKAIVHHKQSEEEVYNGVNSGECALAVTTKASFRQYEKELVTNKDCRLVWVGREISTQSAGFATKADSGQLCTSLVTDVLNLHMIELTGDGTIDTLWKEHLTRNTDQDCGAVQASTTGSSGRRSIQEMASTFILHLILTGVAIVVAVGDKCWINRQERERRRRITVKEAAASTRESQGNMKAWLENANDKEKKRERGRHSYSSHNDDSFSSNLEARLDFMVGNGGLDDRRYKRRPVTAMGNIEYQVEELKLRHEDLELKMERRHEEMQKALGEIAELLKYKSTAAC